MSPSLAFLDALSVKLARIGTGRRGYFTESVESAGLEEHVRKARLKTTIIIEPGIHNVQVDTNAGILDAAYLVHRWEGPGLPTVIYHHGVQESPFELGFFAKNTFKTVLVVGKPKVEANLLAIRAPFHDRPVRAFLDEMASLNNFTAMMGASTTLIEHLIRACRSAGTTKVMVSGISLGGWASNLHHAVFNSADVYVPMLAGAAFGKVFTESGYRALVGKAGRERPEQIEQVLNFEDAYSRVPHTNVYPVLGRYDRYIDFDTQKRCYGDQPILVLDKGHVGAALSPHVLRQHIISHLS
jgi:hypothetical protein